MAKRVVKRESRAKANIGVGGVGSIKYEKKKKVTEIIPPDVTRAKTGRWLDLISPITEWAGLRGDALRFQRAQLRIQQEAALEELADSIKSKLRDQEIVSPLPAKILVPALEAAALEEPSSPLIEWWANLLVQGATVKHPRPFLVDLMKVIGNEEALFLQRWWDLFSLEKDRSDSGDHRVYRAIGYVHGAVDATAKQAGNTENFHDSLISQSSAWIANAEKLGVALAVDLLLKEKMRTFRSKIISGHELVLLDVCRSLNLIAREEDVVATKIEQGRITLRLFTFSSLGVEFMTACRPVQ